MEIAMTTTKSIDVSGRHAHCTFCGGKGANLSAETVISPVTGAHYRVPLSHEACKQSILSLSLSRSISRCISCLCS
jgi:hypothetical protein